jgi:SagB-type dehydrogenase family enzyme
MSDPVIATAAATIELPAPELPSVTLDQALKNRHSTRAFAAPPLSRHELSGLLWSAFGVNRRGGGGRTAPSAHNWQETELVAVLPGGAYRYDAHSHQLKLMSAQDLRSLSGVQDFVATAPLNLVYVADFARMHEVEPEAREFLAGADAGFIAQNVYLFCAAAGLACVVRGLVDRRALAAALQLGATQRISLAQSVGHALPGS